MNFKRVALLIGYSILSAANVVISEGSPFRISAKLDESRQNSPALTVQLHAPAEHYFYADLLEIKLVHDEDTTSTNLLPQLIPEHIPSPVEKKEPSLEKPEKLYYSDTSLVFSISNYSRSRPLRIIVTYQGCNNSVCFPPATTTFVFGAETSVSKEARRDTETATGMREWKEIASRFEIAGRREGYMNAEDFINFLVFTSTGTAERNFSPGHGDILSILLIILWGLALNLTPCVLPMIPVNLAIIGAGMETADKRRGFLLGAVYGLGMMIAYGMLGVLVVLSGAMFGTISSSPWFNATVSILFVVLAFAVLEIIRIDFSRFQPSVEVEKKLPAGSAVFALVMGGISAILAGACVAPAVISVLAFSVTLYNQGSVLGLFLPFLLGLGMALPWPFAGAGLAVLPKPGKWMSVLRYIFAGIILIAALYYGNLAIEGFRWRYQNLHAGDKDTGSTSTHEITLLSDNLSKALSQNKPVLIDFWASWCKNCLAMEKTTFRHPEVQQKLSEYIVVKYRMENPNTPEAKEVRKYFGFTGLPAFVVLKPAR